MAGEIEREGIPVALVTTIESTATMMRASRIVVGGGITHPFGDPGLSSSEEKLFRRRLVRRALGALTTRVEGSHVFADVDPPA